MTHTIVFSIGYVGNTTDCSYFNKIEPITDVDKYIVG